MRIYFGRSQSLLSHKPVLQWKRNIPRFFFLAVKTGGRPLLSLCNLQVENIWSLWSSRLLFLNLWKKMPCNISSAAGSKDCWALHLRMHPAQLFWRDKWGRAEVKPSMSHKNPEQWNPALSRCFCWVKIPTQMCLSASVWPNTQEETLCIFLWVMALNTLSPAQDPEYTESKLTALMWPPEV